MKKMILFSTISAMALVANEITIKNMPSSAKRVYPSNENIILSYNNSIKEIKKSVVNISTTKTVNKNNQFDQMSNNQFLRDFFGQTYPEINQQKRKTSSLGSGVIISQNGYIVTNNHVVEGADEIIVTLEDTDKEYIAKIVGLDSKTDLAVIKIEASKLKAAKFGNSETIKEGDLVFAIGNAFGVGGSITQGIISALNKNKIGLNQYENFIQTDASINLGNSGGALVDSRGALIGINSAILSKSGGNNGIGFAIPSKMVANIAVSLIENGRIDRGYLGVSISDLTKELKEIYKSQTGAFILNVEKNSPASKANLKLGDLIVGIDDKTIKNANDLKNILANKTPGKTIEIKFERNKEIKSTNIVLANMDQSLNQSAKITHIEGLKLQEITTNMRTKYKIPNQIRGVLVAGVKIDSYAHKLGFLVGDIIIQINQASIESFNDVEKTLKEKNKKIVFVNRNGNHVPIVIK